MSGFYDVPPFVECTECGHAIEQHDTKGCHALGQPEGCACPLRWTQAEIRRVRREEGLPPRW